MRRTAVAALLVVLAGSNVAAAATPASAFVDDLARTPMERAAFTALPAVYRVTYSVQVVALDDVTTSYPIGTKVEVVGIAFGIAPGRVVTARGLANPSNRTLVTLALAAKPPSQPPPDPSRLRARVAADHTITLVRSSPVPELTTTLPRPITATVLRESDPDRDLALLAIDDPRAPTLRLLSDLGAGTPVAAVAFDPDTGRPIARFGELVQRAATASTGDDRFGSSTADLGRTEYGAPIIDQSGAVRGLSILRLTETGLPVFASAGAIALLLGPSEAAAEPSGTLATFRRGMETFWRRDYAAAAATLSELGGDTGSVPLASFQTARARELAASDYLVSGATGARGAILAVGAMSTVVAAILGAMLLRRRPLVP